MSKARKLWVVFMTAVMLVIAAAATVLCAGELSRAFGADQVLQPGTYIKNWTSFGGAAVTQGGTNTSKSLKENGYKADVIDGYTIVYFELGGTGSGTAESLADIPYKKGLTVTPHFNVVDLDVKITTNASGRTIEMQLIGPAFVNTRAGVKVASRENRNITVTEITNGGMREDGIGIVTTDQDGKATITTKTTADCEYRFEMRDFEDRPINLTAYRRISNGKLWQEFRITPYTSNSCDSDTSWGLIYEYYYLPKDMQYNAPHLNRNEVKVGYAKENGTGVELPVYRTDEMVTLDLNGHVLDFSTYCKVSASSGKAVSLNGFETNVPFTIMDSDTSKPKHRFRDIGDGVWQLDDLGSNTIEGGAIVGSSTQHGGSASALFYVPRGELIIEGGTFAGNVAGSSADGASNRANPIVMAVSDGKIIVKGGEFRNNTVYVQKNDIRQRSGGIFLLMSKASFEMTGGKIYNNTQYYFNVSGAEQSGGAIILFDPEGNWHPGPQATISGGYVEKMIPAGETSLANGAAISISAHPTTGNTDGKNDILTIEGGYINGAIVNRPRNGIDILDAENSSVTGGYFTQEGIESIQKLGILGAPKTHGGYVAIDLTTDPAGKHYGDTAYNAYGEDLHFRVCEATTASYTGAQKGAPAYDGKPVEEGTDFTIGGFASGITAAKLNATYSYLGQTPAGEGLQGDGLPTDAGTYTVVAHIPAWIDVTRADGLAYLAEDVSFQLVITELGSLDDLTLTASNSIAYRNYVIEPTLSFKKKSDGSAVTLKKDVDYAIISGGEGIDVATYTIYIKGIGGYTGTANAQWTIVARSLTNRYYMYLTEEAAAKKDKNLRMYKVGDYKALEGVTSFTFDGEEHTPTFYGLFGDGVYAEMLAPSDGVHVNTYHPNTKNGVGTYKKDPTEAAKRPMDYQINVDAKTDAGSYTWSITPAAGINNLTGTMSLKWQITARDISEAQIAFTGLSANYTAFEQSVTVKSITFGNYTLTEDDYELQGEWKATDAGKHAFKVVGKGNFKGEVEYEFEIVPRRMSELTIVYNDVFYDGTEKLPDINQVKWVYTPLRVMNPADYTITADKQIDAGTYKLTLAPSGNGNISGNAREFNWQIKIRDLTGAAVELSTPGGFSYDGKEHSQTVVSVTAKDGTKITGGWSVTSGDKGTAAGDYTLVITGDGKNCTKTASVTWAIGKESITGFTLTANNTIPYYNATITPTITLKKTASDKNALTLNTDYKIVSGGSGVNAGDYTLIVEGMGNYTGRLQVDWKIDPRDLSKYVVTLKTSEVVYTGKELTGAVDSIYCNATHKTPIGKDDYTLDWGTGRIDVGTYTLTILPSGNGNVTGKLTAKWKITPRDINDAKIATQLRFGPGEYGTGYETWYGGHDQEILVKSATYNGMTLQEGTDFTVTGNKATNAGDYIIAVKGKGNYNGEWTHDWKITARDMSDVTVTLNELTFNNAEQEPSIKSVLTNHYKWEMLPTDYEIVATPQKDAGDAYTFQLKPSGNGNMTGNPVDITWSIMPFDIKNGRIEFKEQVYNPLGEQTARCNIYVDFPDGATRLTKLDFEIVSGDKGTAAGVYTLVIKGTRNYTGTLSGDWTIAALDIASYKIDVDTDTFTFDGQKHVPAVTKVYTQSAVEIVLDPSDYQIHAAQQTDAGTYTLIIMPANNNTKNSITMIWKIDPRPISDAIFNAPDGGKIPYAGGEQELQFSLTLGSASGAAYSRAVSRAVSRAAAGDYTLRPAYDYTIVSGNKGTDVGGYKLKIDAVGKNFTGSLEIDWQIVPFDLSVAGNVRIETSTLTYSGAERVGGVNVFAVFGLKEVLLSEKTEVLVLNDSNKATEAGKYAVELEGIGNYTGKISAEWEIRQADLSVSIKDPTQVVLDASSFVYDGAKHNPTVTALYLTTMLINALPTSDYTVKVSAETDAGDYTLTIVPASKNVTGSCEVSWKITPLDISNYTLTASNSMRYRNYTITPSLKFAAPASGGILPKTKDVDYKVLSGGEGIDAGDYTIKIEGIGNFTGTLEANWSIGARSLSNRWYMWLDETGTKKIYRVQDKVYVEGMNSFVFDGTEKTPTFFSLVADGDANGYVVSDGVHVNNGDGTFREDPTEAAKRPLDYKIVVDKKTDAGDYTWKVLPADGINNLSDSMTVVWRIQKRDIADASIELGDELTYNGSQQTKLVKNVTVNGGTLKVNYTISGNTGTDAGSYKLTLTGTGNFSGKKEVTWEIKSLDLANAVINFGGNTLTYNGKEQTQTVAQVAIGAIVLSEGKDFTISGNKGTDAKTYTLTVTGDGKNVTGSKDAQWTIAKYDLSGATLTLKPSSFIYNGTAQKQEIDGVTAGALTLNAGTDYTISGDTQTNAGSHTLTITGTGNFTGTCSKAWQIAQFDLTNATFVGTTSFNYDRAAHTPVVTEVTWNGVTLKAEFKVSATAKTDAGNYDFTLVPDGKNVTGSKTIAWEIKALNLKDAKISGTLTFTYNGKAQSVKPTVTLGGLTLKEGTDYTLVATAQTDANSYPYSIKPANNNFIESISGTWEITPADISSAKVTLDKTELTYNFAEQQVKATSISLKGFTSFTYDISGDKATNAGNYEYTITGNGNFKGTVKVAWKILQITLTDANLASAFVPKEYNGKYVTHDDFPDVIVDGHTLVYGRDYTLTGLTAADNSDKKVSHVGHHEATLWGLNNFAGSFAVGFDIVARKIAVEWKVDGQPLKDVAEVAGGHEITALIQENDFLGDGPDMGTNDRDGHMRYRIKILSGTASSVWADGNSSGQAATMQLTAKGKYSLSIEFFDGNGNGSGFNSPSKAGDYTVTTQTFKIADAAVEVKLNITTSVQGAVISPNHFYYDTTWRFAEQELSYSVTDTNGNKLPQGVTFEMFFDDIGKTTGSVNYYGELRFDLNMGWYGFPGPGTYHVRFIGTSKDGLTSYTSPEEVITIEWYVNDQGYKSTDYFDGTTYWGKNSVIFTAERVGGKQFYVGDHLPINTLGDDEKEHRKSFTFTTEGKKTLYYKNENGLTGKIEVNIRFDDTAPTAHIGDGTTADKYLDSKAAGTQYWVYTGDLTAILAGEEGAYESGVKTLEYAFGEAGVEPSTFTAANKTTGYSLKLDHAHDVLYVRVTDYVGNSAVFTATFRHFEKPTASGWKYTKLSGGDFTLSLGNNAFDRAGGVSIGSVSLSGSQFDVNGNQITIRGSVLDELDMSADKENFEVKVSILPSDLGLNQIKNAKELDLACSLMAEVEKATLSESDLTFAPASHGGSFEYDGSAYTGSFTANVSYDTGAITVTFDGSSTVEAGTYKATANVAGSKYYKAASFKNDAWELVVQTRKLEIAIDPFTVEVGTAVQTEDVLYHFVTGSVVKGDEGTVFSFSVDGAELAQPGDKLDVKAECINNNYEIVFTGEQGACSIVAVKITDNTVDVIVEYDGTAHGLEFNFSMKGTPIDLNDGKKVTYKYSLTGNGSDWTETPITATNVKDSVRVYYFVEIENYGEVYGNKQIIINPAQITITITGAESTYGESQAAFSATVDSGTVYGSDVAYTLSCEVDEKSPVGQYEIKVENGENYEVSVTGGTAYYNVTAREITVTIDAASSIYGEQQAALTAQVTKGSLVNGDADPFELFCSVDAQTGAGSYDITGSQKDGNYKITFENGTGAYTVQKRVLTDKTMGSSVIYNGKEQSLNFVFEGFVNGDDIATASKVEYSALGDGSDWSETPITATNVKDSGKVVYYRVTFDNYEVVEGNAVLTIEAREIGDGTTLNVTSTHTYDGTAQEATFDVINTVVSLVRDVDYTVTYRDHTNAGKGVIVLTAKSENFKGTFEWEFEIAKASGLTTSASGYTGEYDGNAHDVGISVNGFIDGASIADGTIEYLVNGVWTSSYTAKDVADSGKIEYRVIFQNYEDAVGTFEVAISQRSLDGVTITIQGSYTYNGKEQLATFISSDPLLTAGDYEIAYLNNVNAGEATITLTGKNNFAGTISVKFAIAKAALHPNVSLDGWVVGSEAGVPVVSGNDGNGSVSYRYTGTKADGTAYDSAEAPTEAGDYTLTVTFAETANYLGASTSVDFSISAAAQGGVAAWAIVLLVIIILIDCALTGILIGLLLRRREREDEEGAAA